MPGKAEPPTYLSESLSFFFLDIKMDHIFWFLSDVLHSHTWLVKPPKGNPSCSFLFSFMHRTLCTVIRRLNVKDGGATVWKEIRSLDHYSAKNCLLIRN